MAKEKSDAGISGFKPSRLRVAPPSKKPPKRKTLEEIAGEILDKVCGATRYPQAEADAEAAIRSGFGELGVSAIYRMIGELGIAKTSAVLWALEGECNNPTQ